MSTPHLLAAGTEYTAMYALAAVVAIVVVAYTIALRGMQQRRMMRAREEAVLARERELAARQQQTGPEAGMRDRAAFDQHMEASKAGVLKMRREMELLEIQVKLATHDLGARREMRDYHDLMMDKARLEIESLKLHIKEQRKRLDEFGTGED